MDEAYTYDRLTVGRLVPLRRTSDPPLGWQCPACGGAHAPDVKTCPEAPPRRKGDNA